MFVGLVLTVGSVAAQQGAPAQEPAPEQQPAHVAPQPPMEFAANTACYLPDMGVFVAIDSIDCAVDVIVRGEDGEMVRKGRFTTDIHEGRHDLVNIVRPVSVKMMGHCIVVLASARKDSSYLAFIPMCHIMHGEGNDTLQPVATIGFQNTSYAFDIDVNAGEIIVAGTNSVGFDVNIVDIKGDEPVVASKYSYHVPKQSERIQASDPIGVGLTVVAICVVFFALVCICFIMKGYGAAIMKVQDRKKGKAAAKTGDAAPAKTKDESGEVYAAIAAAIYAYDQDMHDEEDTVITIQKVERAWTPWNAKFYNMNKYFSTRK